MLNFKKFFVCLALMLFLVSTSVFANSVTMNNNGNQTAPAINTPQANTNNNSQAVSTTPQSVDKDLYIYNTDSYILTDNVNGNIFASTDRFITDPKNNGGTINGNLYVISSEVTISSDVTYANSKDKNGYDIVNSINSKSIINGNVYVLADSFTLQAGSEIHGDLYIAANNVTIEQNAIIDGNLFVTASLIKLNGQVSASAYISAEDFTMTYFTYITRDLFLNSANAKLAGVIHRNAFITTDADLVTESDFRVSGDLSVNFAKNFSFSGEVEGNANINVSKLTFKNDDETTCVIHGNLKYATENSTNVPEGVVKGETTTAQFVNNTESKNILVSIIVSLIGFLAFVFIIVFLGRFFTPNAIAKLSSIDIKGSLIGLAIGFVSIFILISLIIILIFTGVGLPLALFILFGYLLISCLSLPLFLYNIADIIKLNLNIYVKLLIVTIVFFLVSLIPVVGPIIVFISLLIGIGRILFTLSTKRND